MQETVKQDRDKYIGGSDIPIIMELSPFKTRWQLLNEKAGYTQDTFDGNEYTEYGNTLEPVIRDYVNKKLKKKFVEDKIINGNKRYHADGYDAASNIVLEIKTTSQVHEDVNDYKIYLVQLLYGMELYRARNGVLAVYHRPEDFNEELDATRLQIFNIDIRDYAMTIEEILRAVSKFEDNVEEYRHNPLLSDVDFQPLAVQDYAQKIVVFENRVAECKKIIEQYERMKEGLCEAMTDNGVKTFTTPSGWKITNVLPTESKKIEVSEFDEKRFAEEHADLYADYIHVTTKEKKGKRGYITITAPKRENE